MQNLNHETLAALALSQVRHVILEDAAGRSSNHSGHAGEITCPLCGGSLAYTISEANSEVWARCGTPDCVRINQ